MTTLWGVQPEPHTTYYNRLYIISAHFIRNQFRPHRFCGFAASGRMRFAIARLASDTRLMEFILDDQTGFRTRAAWLAGKPMDVPPPKFLWALQRDPQP
jgi:hypothetical protein